MYPDSQRLEDISSIRDAMHQRAHASATQYLLVKGAPSHLAWDKLKEAIAKKNRPTLRRLGILSPSYALLFVNPLLGVGTMVGLLIASDKLDDRDVRRAREEFVATATPVLDLTKSLEQLQVNAPELAIEFDSPILTFDTLVLRLEGWH